VLAPATDVSSPEVAVVAAPVAAATAADEKTVLSGAARGCRDGSVAGADLKIKCYKSCSELLAGLVEDRKILCFLKRLFYIKKQ
jgi:hypothetical protein